jgi:hypothetical protein
MAEFVKLWHSFCYGSKHDVTAKAVESIGETKLSNNKVVGHCSYKTTRGVYGISQPPDAPTLK